jgi:hypothetical protein
MIKALCKLGFGKGQVRRILDALRRETGAERAEQIAAEGLLRRALEYL